MFDRLIHSDWSVSAGKRRCAVACRHGNLWQVALPAAVPPLDRFVGQLLDGGRTLAGFDFPIGLPESYGDRTGLGDFRSALAAFGREDWACFFDVADDIAEVSLRRPFYPRRGTRGIVQADYLRAMGVARLNELHRWCERPTGARRRAACVLFWTLGSNQAGKGAIVGWREVIRPVLSAGGRLWPFDGPLASLARDSGCVICETYPGEAYGHIGFRFAAGESKRRQRDRSAKAGAILGWADRHGIRLEPSLVRALNDGFGPRPDGEDDFDALIGLCQLIEVADGRRSPGPETHPQVRRFEGWIIGQAAEADG